jgi:hypothetical protein
MVTGYLPQSSMHDFSGLAGVRRATLVDEPEELDLGRRRVGGRVGRCAHDRSGEKYGGEEWEQALDGHR